MTKEDLLRTYLEDDLFIEKKYLKIGEAQKYKWASGQTRNLIQVIKIAIEEELLNSSSSITERKINLFINK